MSEAHRSHAVPYECRQGRAGLQTFGRDLSRSATKPELKKERLRCGSSTAPARVKKTDSGKSCGVLRGAAGSRRREASASLPRRPEGRSDLPDRPAPRGPNMSSSLRRGHRSRPGRRTSAGRGEFEGLFGLHQDQRPRVAFSSSSSTGSNQCGTRSKLRSSRAARTSSRIRNVTSNR